MQITKPSYRKVAAVAVELPLGTIGVGRLVGAPVGRAAPSVYGSAVSPVIGVHGVIPRTGCLPVYAHVIHICFWPPPAVIGLRGWRWGEITPPRRPVLPPGDGGGCLCIDTPAVALAVLANLAAVYSMAKSSSETVDDHHDYHVMIGWLGLARWLAAHRFITGGIFMFSLRGAGKAPNQLYKGGGVPPKGADCITAGEV